MPDIVINTSPIIALVAATGSLDWLPSLYGRLIVPFEVLQEIDAGGQGNPEQLALKKIIDRIHLGTEPSPISMAMMRELDLGEASVIHTAVTHAIDTVAIDERAGRRVARIHGLKVTGSIGILLKAKRFGVISHLGDCITRMRLHGIWIAEHLVDASMREAGEN